MTFILDAFVNRPIRSNSPIKISNDSCSHWVSRGNEPIVDVKRHQYFGHSVAYSVSCNVFIKRLIKPFPDYGIDIRRYPGERNQVSQCWGINPLANHSTYQCVYHGWLYFVL